VRARLAASFLIAVLAACESPPPNVPGPRAADARTEADAVGALGARIDRTLAGLAAVDARFARRAGLAPTDAELRRAGMDAIFAEDPSARFVSGTLDPFSVDARARAIARLVPGARPDDALAERSDRPPTRPRLEHELLFRLVSAEKERAAREAKLPRAGSALVRAVTLGWTPPADDADREHRDRWLSGRLEELEASLVDASLSGLERDELADALDPLEARLGAGFAKSEAQLTRLEVRLGDMQTGPAAPWDTADAELRAEVGAVVLPVALRGVLASMETPLREALDATPDAEREDVQERALHILVDDAPCTLGSGGVRMASLPAPEARSLACRLVAAASRAPAGDAAVLLAMHDAVVVASWALHVRTGGAGDATRSARRPRLRLTPESEGRLERRAAVRSVEMLAGALAVGWLAREGLPRTRERAMRWAAFGEAPFDVVWRELEAAP
jgi:hypothetical protein